MADTDTATPLGATLRMTPGTYRGLAVGEGVGHTPLHLRGEAEQVRTVPVLVRRNVAAAASGATATGDGVNAARLIDETEGTNWAARDAAPVAGKGVTVDLAGAAHVVKRLQVSAALRPALVGDADAGGQNRYKALRSFRVLACDAATGADCSDAGSFRAVYTSAGDAFPSVRPRPRVTDLALRSFAVPATRATHLRLETGDHAVHRRTGLRRRAGRRPPLGHRLHDGQHRGRRRARRRAPGFHPLVLSAPSRPWASLSLGRGARPRPGRAPQPSGRRRRSWTRSPTSSTRRAAGG